MFEDETARKEAGSQNSRARFGFHRPGSIRSAFQSLQTPEPFGTESRRERYSRKLMWLLVAVVVLLASAVILGAVLGTVIKPGRSTPLPEVTEIPAGSLPTPTSVQPAASPTGATIPRPENLLASVAVTGWRVPGSQGYNSIWLFWQNKEGYLSRAAYNSSTGNWTRVTNFAKAKEDTPLAAAAVNYEYYAGEEVRVS